MKNKSILSLLAVIIVVFASIYVAIYGIDKDYSLSTRNIELGLDLQGGVSIVYEADVENPTPEEMDSAVSMIRQRLDRKGNTDAEVSIEGTNRILVEIPGVTDAETAVDSIGASAQLMFADMEGNIYLTGSDVKKASMYTTKNTAGVTETSVLLEFTDEGRAKFAEATQACIGQPLLIMLDDDVISAPMVSEKIESDSAVITGNFTPAEATELSELINAGALPFKLTATENTVKGAKLGEDALSSSLFAGALGIVLVMLFMIIVYKAFGAVASVALILFLTTELIAINGLNVTLTLPGIAGIILSIGMAVDANVIIFERIIEEVKSGKTLRVASKNGFSRALPAIVDGNLTTLLAAVILFILGSGPIKGFAQTLAIGIIISMFTALVVTRFILTNVIKVGLTNKKYYGIKESDIKTAKERNEELEGQNEKKSIFNIVDNRKRYFGISATIIGVMAIVMIVNIATGKQAFNYAVEFSGGTAITIDIGQEFENNDISKIIEEVTGDSTAQIQKIVGTNEVAIKMKEITQEERVELSNAILDKYGITDENIISASNVSPTISGEMKSSAILAIIVSCLVILGYITIRFHNYVTGVSAIIALLHDAMIVVLFYAVSRTQLDYSFIAVVLTIMGYSINATIVIFDRVRENRVLHPSMDDRELINTSVKQTLTRSLNTSITTLLTLVSLYIFGVSSIKDFALPLIIGVLVGTYSSVFISGGVWYTLNKKRKPKETK